MAASEKSLGELWFLPGSPWSVRARWAIDACHALVDIRSYRPGADQPALWRKLGCSLTGRPTSVPVLFRHDAPPLRDSLDIAIFAVEESGCKDPLLFPPAHLDRIKEVCALTDVIMSHSRGLFMSSLQRDPARGAEILLPPALRNHFFSNWLVGPMTTSVLKKYPPANREVALAAVRDIRYSLEQSNYGYVVGKSFSFADVCVASTNLDVMADSEPADSSEKYDDLQQWRLKTLDTHFPGDWRQAFNLAQ
jgi:glutathione S-transferase